MSEPYLAEVKIVAFNFPPRGYAFCNGQILPINQNQALFSLLGTFYGGNGTTNFALPNLQGRTPIHFGTNPADNTTYVVGQNGGEASHTLISAELPVHAHSLNVVSGEGSKNNPAGNLPATAPLGLGNVYGPPTNQTALAASAIGPSSVGGGQSHPNLQPYLTLNFVIALQGIFPSRN